MRLVAQQPEAPITETWEWLTDIFTSNNGTEQRVQNRAVPVRTFQEDLVFDNAADIRKHLASALCFGSAWERPLYSYMTRLLAPAALGATGISFNPAATELRDGGKAYIFDRNGGEILVVDAVNDGGCSLAYGLSRAYARGAWVTSASDVVTGNNASISRRPVDGAATAGLTYREVDPLLPFLNPRNAAALTLYNGLPVLDRRPVGEEFEEGVDTGIQIRDEGGAIDLYSPWKHAQIAFKRSYLCHRYSDLADWNWWRKFADYARGSRNPFYYPTHRADFEIVTPPIEGGTTMALKDTDYANQYFPHAPFKQLAITTEAGVHYATVTAAVVAGANTNLTFTPALPVGSGVVELVSLLMRCRIADDKVACYHDGLDTEIELNLRTVDL